MDSRRAAVMFVVAAVLGVVAAFSVSLGLFAALAACVLVVVAAVSVRSSAALSRGLTGIGGTWLVLATNGIAACSRTDDFCGQANYLPFTAVAVGLLTLGLAAGAYGWSTARRRRGVA